MNKDDNETSPISSELSFPTSTFPRNTESVPPSDIGGGDNNNDDDHDGIVTTTHQRQKYLHPNCAPSSSLCRSSTDDTTFPPPHSAKAPMASTSTKTTTATNTNAIPTAFTSPLIQRRTRNRARSLRQSALRRVYLDSQPPPSSHSTDANTSSTETAVDYADTVWWGYALLITTWFVFVVGMGSVLGVWEWAWEGIGNNNKNNVEGLGIGITEMVKVWLNGNWNGGNGTRKRQQQQPVKSSWNPKYGLPIPGYYPALVILTGILSWVWVITAWVGMKYFRHAKITAGD